MCGSTKVCEQEGNFKEREHLSLESESDNWNFRDTWGQKPWRTWHSQDIVKTRGAEEKSKYLI